MLRGAILNNLRSRPSGIPPGGRFALEQSVISNNAMQGVSANLGQFSNGPAPVPEMDAIIQRLGGLVEMMGDQLGRAALASNRIMSMPPEASGVTGHSGGTAATERLHDLLGRLSTQCEAARFIADHLDRIA